MFDIVLFKYIYIYFFREYEHALALGNKDLNPTGLGLNIDPARMRDLTDTMGYYLCSMPWSSGLVRLPGFEMFINQWTTLEHFGPLIWGHPIVMQPGIVDQQWMSRYFNQR